MCWLDQPQLCGCGGAASPGPSVPGSLRCPALSSGQESLLLLEQGVHRSLVPPLELWHWESRLAEAVSPPCSPCPAARWEAVPGTQGGRCGAAV